MLPTFQFGAYTLRPTIMNDFPQAAVWTSNDPDHRGKIAPAFWIDGRDTYLLIDEQGPVFFFKTQLVGEKTIKLYIQFGPDDTRRAKLRTIKGLVAGLEWLEKELLECSYENVYFTSKRPALISFCEDRLGFTTRDGVLSKKLREASDGDHEEKDGQSTGEEVRA